MKPRDLDVESQGQGQTKNRYCQNIAKIANFPIANMPSAKNVSKHEVQQNSI